jgi:tetratricopeptide (TPR) repeat protein
MSSPAADTVMADVDQRLLAGDFDQAIELLETARSRSPGSYVVLQRLGDVYRSMMRPDKAIRAYEDAVALAPEEGDLWVRKGDALSDVGASDAAIEAFKEASRLAPRAFTEYDWNVRGDRCYSYEDRETAGRLYQCGLDVRPNVDGWRGLGVIALDEDRLDDAAVAFRNALDLDPRNAMLLNDLGRVHHRKDELPEALRLFTEAATLAPGDSNFWFNVGLISRQSGDFKAARQAYLHAVELAPDEADTWIELGLCELELGEGESRLRTALRSFERATEVNEASFWAWNNAGWILKQLHEDEAALDRFDRAIWLDPTEYVPWEHKISTLVDIGEVARAESCADEMLNVVASKADAMRIKAALLTDWTPRNDEALELFRAALALEPESVWLEAALAEALLKAGEYQEGRESAVRALQREPDEDIHCGLLFIIYATYVLEGSSSPERRAAFREFIEFFRSRFATASGRRMGWNYRGLISLLHDNAEVANEETSFLLSTAIDLQLGTIDPSTASFFTGQPGDQVQAASPLAPP